MKFLGEFRLARFFPTQVGKLLHSKSTLRANLCVEMNIKRQIKLSILRLISLFDKGIYFQYVNTKFRF